MRQLVQICLEGALTIHLGGQTKDFKEQLCKTVISREKTGPRPKIMNKSFKDLQSTWKIPLYQRKETT